MPNNQRVINQQPLQWKVTTNQAKTFIFLYGASSEGYVIPLSFLTFENGVTLRNQYE